MQNFGDLPQRTVGKDVEREPGVHGKEGLREIARGEAKAIADIDWGEEVGRGQFGLVWVFYTQLQTRPMDALVEMRRQRVKGGYPAV